MLSRLRTALGVGLLALFVGARANAQVIPAFVDPTPGVGNDATGQTGANAGNFPFLTMAGAIAALTPQVSAASPGRIICQPGVISPATNGEAFPIVWPNFISATGKATLIRGSRTTARAATFAPSVPVGARAGREVLIDLSTLTLDGDAVIEGFTFRGGEIQVYFESGPFDSPAIALANNVFDMTHLAPDTNTNVGPITGPDFGVLVVSTPTEEPPQVYSPAEVRFINNTVIMGWHPNPTDGVGAIPCQNGAVGFCDVNDPALLPPPQALIGPGSHVVANNLIRTLPAPFAQRSRAMLGIDAGDTTLVPAVGQFNAFDPVLIGGTTGPGPGLPQYTSAAMGALPTPSININPTAMGGRGPAFVGEYVTRTFFTVSLHDQTRRDWRLLPDSAMINAGVNPYALMGGGTGFAAASGATYTRITADGRDAYDWDFERYGNPRIAAAPQTPGGVGTVDLGADEASNLIFARSYQNESICHNTFAQLGLLLGPVPYPAGVGPGMAPATGSGFREIISPVPGTYTTYVNFTSAFGPILQTPIPTEWLRTSLAPPVLVGGGVGYDRIYMTSPSGPLTIPTTANAPYTEPFDPTALTFGRTTVSDQLTANPSVYWTSVQAVFTPTGGTAVLTNEQEEFYAK